MWNYQREHGADARPRNADGTYTKESNKPIEVQSRRGAPVQVESLARHFTWTIRRKLLGDSLGDIGKDDNVARNAVVKGIEFTMRRLPRPEWVPPAIKQRISALRSLANPADLI